MGEKLTIDVEAMDIDGDPLSYHDDSSMIDIDPVTGRIIYIGNKEDLGTNKIVITVSDGDAIDQITIFIDVYEPNSPPIVSPIDTMRVRVGETLEYQVFAYDPDGDPLTYSVRSQLGVYIDPESGVIKYVASENDLGTK